MRKKSDPARLSADFHRGRKPRDLPFTPQLNKNESLLSAVLYVCLGALVPITIWTSGLAQKFIDHIVAWLN